MSDTSPLEYGQRIHALERINATLAAEVDRMRPVVEVALKVCGPTVIHASLLPLQEAISTYRAVKTQKESNA